MPQPLFLSSCAFITFEKMEAADQAVAEVSITRPNAPPTRPNAPTHTSPSSLSLPISAERHHCGGHPDQSQHRPEAAYAGGCHRKVTLGVSRYLSQKPHVFLLHRGFYRIHICLIMLHAMYELTLPPYPQQLSRTVQRAHTGTRGIRLCTAKTFSDVPTDDSNSELTSQ